MDFHLSPDIQALRDRTRQFIAEQVMVGMAMGLDKHSADILFVFGALPPAVSCFIFADRYRREPEKVAAIVMIGNASALFFIPFALALRL